MYVYACIYHHVNDLLTYPMKKEFAELFILKVNGPANNYVG